MSRCRGSAPSPGGLRKQSEEVGCRRLGKVLGLDTAQGRYEPGGVGGDPHIAGQREPEAGADAAAVDRCHHRLRHGDQGGHDRVVVLGHRGEGRLRATRAQRGGVLGLGGKEIVLLAITAVVSMLTFGSGKATVLQASHHVAVFAAFIFLAIVP